MRTVMGTAQTQPGAMARVRVTMVSQTARALSLGSAALRPLDLRVKLEG